ncbi:MAG: glycine cleavage system protein GcvH [Candidatus Auribacter fodinae]|jgi:glycine cleavage system H protein|uniref:Glycine cleavage system H protein n=1 Tax=Candidatus Auribacter fodinae TaxID=2093366 RepID=A0A3A4R6P7_9BACT|nr:MAG: glycine cleavage system protein GcvH [Candidatus Auribacter fodinae]
MKMNIPASLKYTSSHEWISCDGKTGKVGITDHAQKELGDIVFVELPEVGKTVSAGKACAVVESVKTASDIYTPVSGTITAVNDGLTSRPELINEDCYTKGWIFEVKLSDPSELNNLLDANGYREVVQ